MRGLFMLDLISWIIHRVPLMCDLFLWLGNTIKHDYTYNILLKVFN